MKRARLALLTLLAGTAFVVVTACGSGQSEQLQSLQQQVKEVDGRAQKVEQQLSQIAANVESLQRSAQVGAVTAAIRHIDAAGFHAIDEGLEKGEMNPRWVAIVRNVIAVTEATSWPQDLQETSSAFLQAANELENALAAENVQAAARAAAKAHDTQHSLSHAVYPWLSGKEIGERGQSGQPQQGQEAGERGQGGQQQQGQGSGQEQEQRAQGDQVPEGAVRFTVTLQDNGSPQDGELNLRVKQGDTVAFVIGSQVEGSFHVHGYDREWDLAAGQETTGVFTANAAGRFPLEVHVAGEEDGVPAGYLEVHP